jgi:3-deoxy-D-manno-octulosonic-acid transferase
MLYSLSQLGYRIAVWGYHAAVWCAAYVNLKARLREQGARAATGDLARHREPGARYIWFHCASLGEFEQGRPLIEQVKKECPGYKIALTFYSPSGYTMRHNYLMADWIGYLPNDTAANAGRWVAHLKPELAIFVKYEFWYFHLKALHRAGVPVWLVSATFRPGQWLFKPWGYLMRHSLNSFDRIFVQNQSSADLLASKLNYRALVVGDTRVDRVVDIPSTAAEIAPVALWVGGKPAFVAGSTWPADDKLIASVPEAEMPYQRLVVVPHETDAANVAACQATYAQRYGAGTVVRLSEVAGSISSTIRVLIVDRVGLLSALYRYAHVVYIGGGFGKGIHNTLEPAAWLRPLAFGPRYEKFNEAVGMVESGGARPIADVEALMQWLLDMQQSRAYAVACMAAGQYIHQNQGATKRIVQIFKDQFSCEQT